MASTSVSSVEKMFKYDVFLSFRGEDTRKNFVDHLYHALHRRGITTFKDDERIKKGERISEQLIRSIEDSRFHIIVFSKNYASSSWCLDELVKIMECHKTTEQTAYPVFYDVEPTHVRNQSGAVGEAFAKHVEKEGAGRWIDALKEATNLAGWELKTTFDGHEAKFIEKIMEEILPKLHFTNLSVDENLVGMKIRVKNVVSSLEAGSQDVCMIGIKGMGGGGKTTLARAVFDNISIMFESKSFVENVREGSKGFGLKELQKQVLQDVLNDKSIDVKSVDDGKNMMKKIMPGTKVLVVLDDVDDIDQLKALSGEPTWFKPGSRIIITTRDKQVLVAHGVHRSNIHDVNLLSNEEAICLFSRYAFKREIPIQGYEELSRKVVYYAAGLPLTITVLGSFLCGRAVHEWEDALGRLKTIPEDQTLKRLELSYNGLENDHKEIFLDVACILRGETKDYAVRILESCGFNAQIGLSVLEQKSLITISHTHHLHLHDLIAEMGWNIVRRLHPDEPSKHNRLWIKEEIEDILVNELGTEATRCLKLNNTYLEPIIIMKGLRKMKELRYLYVGIVLSEIWKSDEVSQYLPDALRSLYWPRYPFCCLPVTFRANKLVNLEIGWSSISQLWEGGERKVLNKLRFLDLKGSQLRTFDLGITPNLETLDLSNCSDFVELNISYGCPKLKFLNVRHSNLSYLNLGLTPHLEKLNLGGCNDFVELHMPVECSNLKFLNLSASKVRNLNLGMTPHLETLDLEGCNDFVELNMSDGCLKLKFLNVRHSKLSFLNLGLTPHLENLNLGGCNDFVELHMPVECSYLKFLNVSGSKVSNLNLGMTPHLETLDLEGCNDFVELNMSDGCPKLKFLNVRHSKLSNFNLGLTPHLEKLNLGGCNDFVELHMPVECSNLEFLNLSGSKVSDLNLGMTPLLETLDLEGCNNFVDLHVPVECLKLKFLTLSGSKLTNFNLGMTPHLYTLDLEGCIDFVELHVPVECPNLEMLDLSGSKVSNFNLGLTPNLKMLVLGGNEFEELHMPVDCPNLDFLGLVGPNISNFNLGMTPYLRTLDLRGCNNLVELHMPFEFPELKFLYLEGSKVTNLNLGMTPYLEELDLEGCNDFVELHMPVECSALDLLNLSGSKVRNLNLGMTPYIETLDLGGCNEFLELYMSVQCSKLKFLNLSGSKVRNLNLGMTPYLETLDLGGCNQFLELHMPVECPDLEFLNLSGSKVRNLNLGMTPHLNILYLKGCNDFVELHMPVALQNLKFLNLSGSKVSNLNLGLTPSLEILDLNHCYYLQEIQAPVGCLKNMVFLNLSGCSRFQYFMVDKRNESPGLDSVATLELTAQSLDICPLHPNNNLPKFQFKCFYDEPLPSLSGNLEKLISFGLCACTNLESFSTSICGLQHLRVLKIEGSIPEAPKNLWQLENLEKLSLWMKEIKHLPDSICMLKHLKYLSLKSCLLLEQLPMDLGRLEFLEELRLKDCISLRDIPNSICNMKFLKFLSLPNCIRVEKLPEELGHLECLKGLRIDGTGITHLPESMFRLKVVQRCPRISQKPIGADSQTGIKLSTVGHKSTMFFQAIDVEAQVLVHVEAIDQVISSSALSSFSPDGSEFWYF
ncbi:hypothetical protein L1987_01313 [Smallanthus sonchifolius]|uniref:Uncharacterized protein n=1 Tax=Smallanthus sonchifolius TaxID=185202 RepID=A0ACB9K4P4_9ASTR|nr:hypothetical protein L1987_01313 [Smallanthus sonchifolius]